MSDCERQARPTLAPRAARQAKAELPTGADHVAGREVPLTADVDKVSAPGYHPDLEGEIMSKRSGK